MPSSNSKGFTIVYLLLVAAIGSIAAIALYSAYSSQTIPISPQNAQPVIEEETYTDPDFNFSFKFPAKRYQFINYGEKEYFAELTKTDLRKNFTGYVGYEPPKFIKGFMLKEYNVKVTSQFAAIPLMIWVFDNPQGLSVDQWYEQYWYYPFLWGQFAQPFKGQSGPNNISTTSSHPTKYNIIPYQPAQPKFTYLIHQGKMFLFRLSSHPQTQGVGEKAFESFKFN